MESYASTFTPRALTTSAVDNVLRLEIKPDGRLGRSSIYAYHLDGLPDGMAFTETGDLLVVTGLYEIIYRVKKRHHAGLIVRSPHLDRVNLLLNDYGQRFAEDFVAVAPPPERPE